MKFVPFLLVAAVVFGVCWLLDRGFSRVFRGKAQHRTGLSVRLNRRYASIGLVVAVLGIAALLQGTAAGWLLPAAGGLLLVVGLCLVIYYMTFGVFYDRDSFVLTTFGKKSVVYRYSQIRCQQLYNSYGNILIELELADGRVLQLQSGMTGVYPFLDTAFEGWLRQKGISEADCPFHDPDNSCWFPTQEEL